jgi:hypothetical protein
MAELGTENWRSRRKSSQAIPRHATETCICALTLLTSLELIVLLSTSLVEGSTCASEIDRVDPARRGAFTLPQRERERERERERKEKKKKDLRVSRVFHSPDPTFAESSALDCRVDRGKPSNRSSLRRSSRYREADAATEGERGPPQRCSISHKAKVGRGPC